MALNTVTLTWNITDLIQSAVGKSTLVITPTSDVSVLSLGTILTTAPRTYTFTGGTGSVAGLVATDNAGMTPATFLYRISVMNAVDTRFTLIPEFRTPIAFANGTTQDLAALLAAAM